MRVAFIVGLLVLVAALGIWRLGAVSVPEAMVGVRSDGSTVDVLAPGNHWFAPGGPRIALYPTEPETLLFPPEDGTYRMFDAAGEALDVSLAVIHQVDPERAGELHAAVAGDLAGQLETRLRQSARPVAAQLDATEPDTPRRLAEGVAAQVRIPGLEVRIEPRAADEGNLTFADRAPRRTGVRLLLVGIDAGDWKILDPLLAEGRLPHLAGLIARGVRADLHTLSPMLSPLLWTSIATGTTPDRHGILDFLTPDPETGEMIPVTSGLRREPAFWNYLTEVDVSTGLIGWLATWPAERVNGTLVSDRFGFLAFAASASAGTDEGMTWPPEYAIHARSLEVHPQDLETAFWQRFLDVPARELEDLGEGGFRRGDLVRNFALTITTALSNTRIAEDLQRARHPRVVAVYYEMIDAVGHLVMPYAPPRRPEVTEAEFGRYGGAMAAAYELQDELLGRLLVGTDDRTVVMVISDHGFRSGNERPSGTADMAGGEAGRWHRDPGIAIFAGPGIRQGEVLDTGMNLLDIMPTLLAVTGVPVPAGLDGRVLEEIFTPEGQTRYAPTLETEPRELRPEVWVRPEFSGAASAGPAQAAMFNNLGLVLEADGKLAEAEANFRKALEANPGDRLATGNLGGVLLKQGRLEEAGRYLEEARRTDPGDVRAAFNLGVLQQRRGRFPEAETLFRFVVEKEPGNLPARVNLGHTLLRTGHRAEAEALFRGALADDPGLANAHFGLGIVAAERGDREEAVREFRRTLELDPGHASAAANLRALGG